MAETDNDPIPSLWPKCEPFDFDPAAISVPDGTRLFSIGGAPVITTGPKGSTRVYVHPDDLPALKAANPGS
jgi:hypothetical protein